MTRDDTDMPSLNNLGALKPLSLICYNEAQVRNGVMIRSRRKARAMALQALYELDSGRHDAGGVIGRLLQGSDLSEENQAFIRERVKSVLDRRQELDRHICQFATAFPIEQIPVIDRNILRLAIFEILFDNSVSVKIAINEAVELAKKFGGDKAPKFVNGVLGSVSTLAKR